MLCKVCLKNALWHIFLESNAVLTRWKLCQHRSNFFWYLLFASSSWLWL